MDTIAEHATRAAAAVASLLALPLMCGPAGDAETGDMNRDWACLRSHRVYNLHTWHGNLRRDAERVATRRSEFRARNLAAYVVEEADRLNRITTRILAELPACQHADEVRAEMTVAEALPGCTC